MFHGYDCVLVEGYMPWLRFIPIPLMGQIFTLFRAAVRGPKNCKGLVHGQVGLSLILTPDCNHINTPERSTYNLT